MVYVYTSVCIKGDHMCELFMSTLTHIAGVAGVFTILSTNITLQPNETSATVSINVIDDQLPEDNLTHTINGFVPELRDSQSITITIIDDDCKYNEEYNRTCIVIKCVCVCVCVCVFVHVSV